nr:BAG family molecular chaperone regulator 7 [Tanacetum cinerariifolium]
MYVLILWNDNIFFKVASYPKSDSVGADIMVRAAKRSMVDELEAMLDVVDPQPGGDGGRSLSMKRRTFDMPDGVIQKELAAGVARVVRMLGQENPEDTFEACLLCLDASRSSEDPY